MDRLAYDVVIATRNRPHLIPYSLRSLLSQSVLPQKIIMVDASDDHEAVIAVAEQSHKAYGVATELIILQSPPSKGMQCNKGLQHVTAPVVMIPDDDSIFLPEACDHVLAVYEMDTNQEIGGVEFSEARVVPAILGDAERVNVRKASLNDRLLYRFSRYKSSVLRRFAENPMSVAAREQLANKSVPVWLSQCEATPIPYQIGFRMTFRSELVRSYGFNETVTRGVRYDDFDISLSVLRHHLLVRTSKGFIYHFRAGGARDQGLHTGLSLLLNPTFITCRHTEPGSAARAMVKPFANRLAMDYGLRALSSFGRDRLRGIWRARRWLPFLLEAAPTDLASRYLYAFAQCEKGLVPETSL